MKSTKYQSSTPHAGEDGPAKETPLEDNLSAKSRFIQRLKLFLYKEKGEHIYDQVLMDVGSLFLEQLKSGTLTQTIEVAYTLDIDIMALTFFDQFVAENLTRCIFRYSASLS